MSDSQRALPAVDFSSFIVSLASSGLVALGEQPDPSAKIHRANLAMARHTIDVLGVIEEKTKGNLNKDEAHLLETLTYELRMKYLEHAKA
ncbi:MAG: DUF1844 domain-containing protein [Deltaproteobacteria bacterium]|nr:DUF1844 domain-containing protein [Deltaproteobacteria bacterium]